MLSELSYKELQVLKSFLKYILKDVEKKQVKFGDYDTLDEREKENYDTLNNTRRVAKELLRRLI